jgi:hypothetical protein
MLVYGVLLEVLSVMIWESAGHQVAYVVDQAKVPETLDNQANEFDEYVEASVFQFNRKRWAAG